MSRTQARKTFTREDLVPASGFTNCCTLTGDYDGSNREHFFQEVESDGSKTGALGARCFVHAGRTRSRDSGTAKFHDQWTGWACGWRNAAGREHAGSLEVVGN